MRVHRAVAGLEDKMSRGFESLVVSTLQCHADLPKFGWFRKSNGEPKLGFTGSGTDRNNAYQKGAAGGFLMVSSQLFIDLRNLWYSRS